LIRQADSVQIGVISRAALNTPVTDKKIVSIDAYNHAPPTQTQLYYKSGSAPPFAVSKERAATDLIVE